MRFPLHRYMHPTQFPELFLCLLFLKNNQLQSNLNAKETYFKVANSAPFYFLLTLMSTFYTYAVLKK